jgi:hypothetical protein
VSTSEKIKKDPATCFPCHAYSRHWHRSWYRSVKHLATSVWSSRNAVAHCLPSMDSTIRIQDMNTILTESDLFNHLCSLEKEIDGFLTTRGCSPIGDLLSKLRYLRDKEYYLFSYRPRVLGGGSLSTHVRGVISGAKKTRNEVFHKARN